jgi:FKBP-type peptidyl-prolyl cis-trans isomerase FkpA
MNFKLPLVAAFVAVLSLTACGGGGSGSAPTTPAESPSAFSVIDTTVGTGAVAASGNTVAVHYTGYVYSSTATGNKGKQFDSSVGKSPLEFKLGSGQVITGFDKGVTGMKVGGKRTVLIPSAEGYGAGGNAGAGIPGGAGLVFDVELVTVK